ncbi:hypothetical protein Tco_0966686 [Tanacetum coccineum]
MAKLIKQRSHEVQEFKNSESSYLFKKKQDLKFEVKVKLVTNKHRKSREDYKELRAEDINMECYNSPFRIKNDLNLGEIGFISVISYLIAPDFEASRAHGFVLRSLELHILSFIMGIQYPNLID